MTSMRENSIPAQLRTCEVAPDIFNILVIDLLGQSELPKLRRAAESLFKKRATYLFPPM